MKFKKLSWLFGLFLLAPTAFLLTSCSEQQTTKDIKLATYNLSFAIDNNTDTFETWQGFMAHDRIAQDDLINQWKALPENTQSNNEIKVLAERIIQIRNVAAVIQFNRPDVLVVNEFNSDGTDKVTDVYTNFQKNYLDHGQSLNSVDGGNVQSPIKYPFVNQYATNTGLLSDFDLNNDGRVNAYPDDAWGFGYFHGQYAFGLMSMHPIVEDEVRTFQEFKWKDMPNAEIPKITANDDHPKMPEGMKKGDNWYTDEEWAALRLSSKNHVDVPIKINGTDQKINLLLSHPTPPAFDTVTQNNVLKNAAEVEFWRYYVENADFIYDDAGKTGGIDGSKQKFVVLGDLNADPLDGDGKDGIISLSQSSLINQSVMSAELRPVSNGAAKEPNPPYNGASVSRFPQGRTSTFGLRVDYSLPSKNLEFVDAGVYWQAEGEAGRLLFNDPRIGRFGNGKEVSSDHRLVWSIVRI